MRDFRFGRATAAAILASCLALTACGGSDDAPPATPAAYTLNIAKTEDVSGTFGSVGAYERLTGTFTGEVDPKDPKNVIIQDLGLAPVNANGKVEYTAPTSCSSSRRT